jgi:hypothetical protein
MDFYKKYYGQLVGFTIVAVSFEEDIYAEGEFFPVLHLEKSDGESLKLTLSSDEEGNGAGFAFIEEDEMELV